MAAVNVASRLESLLRLQQDLALETDLDKVLKRIVETATSVLDAERATIYVIDAAKNELWSRVLIEGTEAGVTDVREIRLPLDGRSLAAEVARTGEFLSGCKIGLVQEYTARRLASLDLTQGTSSGLAVVLRAANRPWAPRSPGSGDHRLSGRKGIARCGVCCAS